MTFNPSEYQLIYKERPSFCQWAISRGALFLPKIYDDGNGYDLTSKAYIFMKRLHQSYETFMRLESEERDKLFEIELQLMKKEAEGDKNDK